MVNEPVRLTSPGGIPLAGIVHRPDSVLSSRPRAAVHILNPGLKNRVAPNRMNKRIADALCGMGYWVLRSDAIGIGDSGGELPDLPVNDLWGKIQMGLFVEDVMVFNRFLLDESGAECIVLIGSCGGAITSLFSGAVDPSVEGLVLIDLPVTLSSTKTERTAYYEILAVDGASRERMADYYMKAVFSFSSLKRFLTFRSDYRAILRVFGGKIRALLGQEATPGVGEHININPLLSPSLEKFYRRPPGQICFLCAEKDSDTQLFEKGFRSVHLPEGNTYEGRYRIQTIPDANHIYSEESSQEALGRAIYSWIDTRYPLDIPGTVR